MKVKLLSYTKDAERLCAAAARSCYSKKGASKLLEEIDEERAGKAISEITGMGHHSVIEHASYTFSIEGVSRALTHQLVRHRIASFSQQSQRYVSMKEATFVIPPSIVGTRHSRPSSRSSWPRPGTAIGGCPRRYQRRTRVTLSLMPAPPTSP